MAGKQSKCTVPNSAVQARLDCQLAVYKSKCQGDVVCEWLSEWHRRPYHSTNYICLKEHCIFQSAKSILYIWKCWSFKLSVQLQVLLCVFMSNIQRHLWRHGDEGREMKKETSTTLVKGRSLSTMMDYLGCWEKATESRCAYGGWFCDFRKCGIKCCFTCLSFFILHFLLVFRWIYNVSYKLVSLMVQIHLHNRICNILPSVANELKA